MDAYITGGWTSVIFFLFGAWVGLIWGVMIGGGLGRSAAMRQIADKRSGKDGDPLGDYGPV